MKTTQWGFPTDTRGHGEEAVAHLERDAHDLAIRAVHGDLRRAEGGVAHLDGHLVHAPAGEVAHRLDHAALRLDPHGRLLEAATLPEVLREDPEAVAGLLGLAPVGIEDAEPHVGDARGRPEKDPVRADAPVAVADPADRGRAQREVDVPLLHDEVVVPEPVPLRESRHRLLASGVGAGRRLAALAAAARGLTDRARSIPGSRRRQRWSRGT